MLLAIVVVAILLLVAGGWWTFAMFAWLAWERRFQSPALRAQIEKGGSASSTGLADVVIFGLPMVVPSVLAFDGLLVGLFLYVPAWTFLLPEAGLFQMLGAALLFLGLILFTAGAYLTGKYVYSKVPDERPLLLRGPFRYVRHPIYLSFLLIGTGFVLLAMNVLALLCLSLFVNVKGWTHEEAELERLYGERYRQYRKRTGAFLPRLRPRN